MRLRDVNAEDAPAVVEIYDFAVPIHERTPRERREMLIKDEAEICAVGFTTGGHARNAQGAAHER
jgi:hypothetical protein